MRLLPTVLILGVSTVSLGGQESGQDKAAQIEQMVRHYHEHGMFNGAVLVKDRGEILYQDAFGLADFRDGTPLGLDTPVYLGSVSKQFTATAVLLLSDGGELELDDHLVEYLPEFKGLADDVTIHQLLTHTSGIPDHLNDLRTSHVGQTNADVVRILLEHGKLNFEPGKRYSYSNGGYVLLSMIVEKVAGQSFAEFMAARVFEPLGMKHTAIKDSEAPIAGRAVGFNTIGALNDHRSFTTGAGGMYSTVGDLAAWDASLHTGELLKPATLEAALSPHERMPGRPHSYGYGWMIRKMGSETIASHAGGLAGYKTLIMSFRTSKHCIILLSNQGAAAATGVVGGIIAVLNGQQPRMQRVRIGPYMASRIRSDGVTAALERYDEITNGDRAGFDLGERELNVIGYEYLRAGQVDIALALQRKNAEVFSESANAYDSLAETLMEKGDRRAAIVNYAKSLVLDPDNVGAIDMLQRLKEERR